MLTFWNRKELCITSSLRAIAEVRDVLSQNDIAYVVKTDDRAMARMPMDTQRIPLGRQTHALYSVFVHKKDYDLAKHLIHSISFRDS